MGKIYLFFALSRTDGRVPSQQGFPTTFFSADVSPGTSGHFWWGGGGGGVVRRRKNGCGQPARIGLKKTYFEEQIFWVLVSPLLRGSI